MPSAAVSRHAHMCALPLRCRLQLNRHVGPTLHTANSFLPPSCACRNRSTSGWTLRPGWCLGPCSRRTAWPSTTTCNFAPSWCHTTSRWLTWPSGASCRVSTTFTASCLCWSAHHAPSACRPRWDAGHGTPRRLSHTAAQFNPLTVSRRVVLRILCCLTFCLT